MTKKSSFVHHHVHADSSQLDGLAQVTKLVPAAKEMGMPAIALTDHGSMASTYDLYKATKEAGIKGIYGIEAYIAPESRHTKSQIKWNPGGEDDVSGNGAYLHATLLARTDEGLHNLMKLSSLAYLEGYYYKPRMDDEILAEYNKGIIATTGCPSGAVQTWLRIGRYDKAIEAAAKYRDIFEKGSYFVELMDHGLDIERRVIKDLMKIAKELNLPTLATNDLHYIRKEDSHAHDALLCIGSASTLDDPKRFKFDTDGFYLKSAEEMRAIWDDVSPDACDNTLLVADMCEATFKEGLNLMPEFPVPEGETEASWFKKEVFTGLARRYPDGIPEDRIERAEYEVDVINKMGFPSYFLVTADFINWAKNNGCMIGPGRGSAAGSIVAYAMGITELDPIKYGLLFERFLSISRVDSLPDIDVDLDDRYRYKVVDYVIEKYGRDKVANIATSMKIKGKSSLKDAGRVLGQNYDIANKLNKVYPKPVVGRDLSLSDIYDPSNERYDEGTELRALVEADPEAQKIVELAKELEGTKRGFGMHAAGIILSREPITNTVPVMKRDTNSPVMTAFEYAACEKLGLLKMDFLGLSNLGTLDVALKQIKKNKNIDIDLSELAKNPTDKKTYDLLAEGNSIGVFQLDSPPMRSLLRSIIPDAFADISSVLALYRPGPLSLGSPAEYADRKNGRKKIVPIHPELKEPLKDILGETYGLCLTGDTLIWDATTGARVKLDSIKEQVESGKFKTFGINNKGTVEAYPVTNWIPTGQKEVLKLTTNSGSTIRLSEDHPVLTPSGWKKAGELQTGVDRLASPASILPPISKESSLTPHEEDLFYANQHWDGIKSIEIDGIEEMYDITVDEVHNFLANGFVVHNCVYQEQIMSLAQKVAGYSLGKADILRKAMGKKDKVVLAKEFAGFKEGMQTNGYSEECVTALWDTIAPFADYAFNKAHSAAYGMVSYWTAYLKANFPAEYMAALLTTNSDDKDKTAIYLAECRRMGLEVLPPDVNKSDAMYTAHGESIRFGLAAIKNVGEAAVESWVNTRNATGPAVSFVDFLNRGESAIVKKKAVESLIKAGAFDSLGKTRSSLFDVHVVGVERSAKAKKAKKVNVDQDSLFGFDIEPFALDIPDLPEWERREKLGLEREMLGLYVSDHPLADLTEALAEWSDYSIADVKDGAGIGGNMRIAGLISSMQRKVTKKGDPWALLEVEDLDASISVYCFPKTYRLVANSLANDAVVVVTGRAEERDDGSVSFMATALTLPDLTKATRSDPNEWRDRKAAEKKKAESGENRVGSYTPARAIDADDTRPIVVKIEESDLTEKSIEKFKVILGQHPGSRPVVLNITQESGETMEMALGAELTVTGTSALASAIRELFGASAV
jgi:DNA polymerase III alpha subunit